MRIYIQTRGISQDQDYCWLQITANGQNREDPLILREAIPGTGGIPVYEMIDSKNPSIVLVRFEQELLLLVTALKGGEGRIDYMGRQIRNSIAWVYPNSDENKNKVRSLVIQALNGELQEKVAQAVNPGEKYGFVVSFKQIYRLAEPEAQPKDFNALPNNSPDEEIGKIGKNSLELREALALYLERDSLPRRQGLLVLVTSLKSASALEKANVWRGLSNKIEGQDWKIIRLSGQGSPNRINQEQLEPEKKLGIMMTLITIIVIIMAMILVLIKFVIPPTPQPQIQEETQQTLTNQKIKCLEKKEELKILTKEEIMRICLGESLNDLEEDLNLSKQELIQPN